MDNNVNSIELVMSSMLNPAGLDENLLNKVLSETMKSGIDYADLYFQVSRNESWMLEDGQIREGSFNIDQGVGVRAISGEKTGFAYSDELLAPALQDAANSARAIVRQGQENTVKAWSRSNPKILYKNNDPTTSIDDSQKIKLLKDILCFKILLQYFCVRNFYEAF